MVCRVKKQKKNVVSLKCPKNGPWLTLVYFYVLDVIHEINNYVVSGIMFPFFFGVHVSITREPCSENDITDVNQNVLGSQLTARAWLQKLIHVSCPEKDRFSGVSFSKVFTLLRHSVPEKEQCFLS